MGPKTDLYHRAGVPLYVIVDRGPRGDDPAQLIGRRRTARGWRRVKLDSRGWLSLSPIPLFIGIKDELTWFYDANGNRLPDPVNSTADAREAREKAREEAEARKKAEARARRRRSASASWRNNCTASRASRNAGRPGHDLPKIQIDRPAPAHVRPVAAAMGQ